MCVETYCAFLLLGAHTLKHQLLVHDNLHFEVAAVAFAHTWVRVTETGVTPGEERLLGGEPGCLAALCLLWTGCGCS